MSDIFFLKKVRRTFHDIEQNICQSVVRDSVYIIFNAHDLIDYRVQLRAGRRSGRPRRLLCQVRGQPVRYILVRVSGKYKALSVFTIKTRVRYGSIYYVQRRKSFFLQSEINLSSLVYCEYCIQMAMLQPTT